MNLFKFFVLYLVFIPYMQKSELGCVASKDLLCLKLVSQIVETIEACVN